MSTAEYQIMKDAQSFFQQAITTLTGKDVSTFKSLLESYLSSNSNITIVDILQEFHSEGKTLLHVAASQGKHEAIEFILTSCKESSGQVSSAYINRADVGGTTPLMYATIAESIECMEILIKNGANVNLLNKDGASCVHFASGEGNVKALDILHNAKADMSVSSGAGTILHWAAGKGRAEVVEYILEKLSFDVNVSNKQGLTPIFMAAAVNNDACVHALLMHHARIDGLLSGGLNLLHICAENGLSQSVQTIVSTEEGQKLNQMSTVDGNRPIHLAAMSEHVNIVNVLRPYNLDLYDADKTIDEIIVDGKDRLKQWHDKYSKPVASVKSDSKEDVSPAKVSTENAAKAEEHKVKGNGFFSSKNYDQAIEEYSLAIKIYSASAPLWSNRSACYMAMKEYNKALQDAEMCRRLDPTWVKGCYRLAVARLALGLYEDAAVAAFEGCKIDDTNDELKKILKEAVALGQEEHKRKLASNSTNKS